MSAEVAATWSDVLSLVERLEGTDFEDVAIEMPGLSLRVARHGLTPGTTAAPAPVSSPTVEAPVRGQLEAHQVEITAPILGVVYRRPAPDQPPFVDVGSDIDEHTTVAIVEVMKLMNQVPAGVSGRIVAILAEDGDLVEFGQPLFVVDTSGAT